MERNVALIPREKTLFSNNKRASFETLLRLPLRAIHLRQRGLSGRRSQQGPSVPPLSQTHGSANWADAQAVPRSEIATGVMFGKSSHPTLEPDYFGAPVMSAPEAHTLVVAQTRAGKGARVIVPTLLRYGSSMLVIDPKGEKQSHDRQRPRCLQQGSFMPNAKCAFDSWCQTHNSKNFNKQRNASKQQPGISRGLSGVSNVPIGRFPPPVFPHHARVAASRSVSSTTICRAPVIASGNSAADT